LLHIVNKLLGRQNLNFEPPEQKLWNLFENSDIYEFLTSEKDTTLEFRHNWITCNAKPKVTFDYQGFLDSWAAINQQPQPPPQPVLQRSISDPSPVHHNLWDRRNRVNYRTRTQTSISGTQIGPSTSFNSSANQIKIQTLGKSMHNSAKATVTRLELFLQGLHPLLPHLHCRLLHLLHHGTSGLQSRHDQCSAGSGAITARLQLC
jgi:hypothetical protein